MKLTDSLDTPPLSPVSQKLTRTTIRSLATFRILVKTGTANASPTLWLALPDPQQEVKFLTLQLVVHKEVKGGGLHETTYAQIVPVRSIL